MEVKSNTDLLKKENPVQLVLACKNNCTYE
jgi:hypothetical protein